LAIVVARAFSLCAYHCCLPDRLNAGPAYAASVTVIAPPAV